MEHLNDHDWQIAKSTWAKAAGYKSWREGSRWVVNPVFGKFPKFRTQSAATWGPGT